MYLGTEEIVLAVVAYGVIAAMAIPGVRALTGKRRAWTVKPPYNFNQVSSRNTWPFMMTWVGVAGLLSLPATYFEAIGDEAMRQRWWDLPFIWIPVPFILLAYIWWPAKLAPRWYREWVERGGQRFVMPWSDDEIAAVRELPEGRGRMKMLEDIDRCRQLTAAAGADA